MLSVNVSMWFCQNITMKSLLLNDKYKRFNGENLQSHALNNETLINIFDLLSQHALFCTFSLKYKMTRFGYFSILSNKESLFITQNHDSFISCTTNNVK